MHDDDSRPRSNTCNAYRFGCVVATACRPAPLDFAADRLVSKPLDVPVVRGVIGIHQLVLGFKAAESVDAVKAPQHLKVKPALSHGRSPLVQLQSLAMP